MERALHKLISDFSREMKAKLAEKSRQGWTGWDDMSSVEIKRRLGEHVNRELLGLGDQEIDVANLCAFLWYAKRAASNPTHEKGV